MAVQCPYKTIIKYKIKAKTEQPLHIGSADDDKETVLVHPLDQLPFIQASSIAGVFREYFTRIDSEKTEKLFGSSMSGEISGNGSLVRISDGIFEKDTIKMELRPRLHMNPETRTCDAGIVKGTENKMGHKFQMEYIGAGAEFSFDIYLYDDVYEKDLSRLFTAIQEGSIRFGGQKSNGCGYFCLKQLLYRKFDMTQKEERRKWAEEENLDFSEYKDKLAELTARNKRNCYDIVVKGETEGALLVKSIAVTEYEKGSPDCMNIKNADGYYIIPGSSMKGAIRGRMEQIASYLRKEEIIDNTFGIKKEENKTGKTGNICFFDTIVGKKEENDHVELRHRIHIDKFTGGVMHGGLFTEKNIFGKMEIHITIQNKNDAEQSCGILLMALRDLAIGTMNIGSGYSIGKGIIHVNKIEISDYIHGGWKAELDFDKKETRDEHGIIKNCLNAVKGDVR